MTSETEEQLGQICLSVAVQVTNSPFGMIGKINDAGRFAPLAVNHPGPHTGVAAMDGLPAAQLPSPYDKALQEAFLSNRLHWQADRIPGEHPNLHSFMGVPLISNEKVIGIVAVSNRAGGYAPEDLQIFRDLAGAIVQALVHKRTEKALAYELANNKRLQEISARLIPEGELDALLSEILKAAIDFLNADMGNIQLYDAVAGELKIIAHQGLDPCFLDYFKRVKTDMHSACGGALETGRRMVVPDVQTSPIFRGQPSLAIQLKAGVRAVQSTPLVSRAGQIIGMISTHWRQPQEPGQRELRFLDMLARQAADAIERQQTQIALQNSHGRLEQRVVERTVELEIRARQLQRLALELSQAEEREHERIAEILHEDLQQYLSALKFKLWDLFPEDRMEPEIKEKIVELENLVNESIQKTRRLSHELSPPVLKQNGLVAGLKWLNAELLQKHGLHVRLTIHGDVEPESAAIASVLFRATRELLINIVKHAETDSALINVEKNGQWIRISVSDNGKGFDPENCIIDKNQTGFGLFNLRERISYLGGQVEIKSAPAKGCSVTMMVGGSVPTQTATLMSPVAAQIPVSPVSTPAKTKSGKIRILLADDHTIMREGMANLFKGKNDFEVVAQAANGRQAVQYAAQFSPDIILMDVSMPEMDGIEATDLISKAQPGIRIIGLSMHDDGDTQKRMLAAGASAYVYKAAPAGKLLETIRQIVLPKAATVS